jgi:hypothetical protein
MDLATGLSCDIDGVSIRNVEAYRVRSPLFTFGPLPAGNILGVPEGTTSPSVSDGVFLMLRPLSAGSHVIHFSGAIPEFEFGMHITYNLTVAGSTAQGAQVLQGKRTAPNAAAPEKKTTWGTIKVIYR